MLPEYGQKVARLTIEGKEYMGRQVILPMPPSENERLSPDWSGIRNTAYGGYYAQMNVKKRGTMKNSLNYNRWLNAAKCLIQKGHLPLLEGEICCFVTVVFPDHRRRDGHNRTKALFDAFTYDAKKGSGIYKDDSLVTFCTVDTKVIKDMSFVAAILVERSKVESLTVQLNQSTLDGIVEQIRSGHAQGSM